MTTADHPFTKENITRTALIEFYWGIVAMPEINKAELDEAITKEIQRSHLIYNRVRACGNEERAKQLFWNLPRTDRLMAAYRAMLDVRYYATTEPASPEMVAMLQNDWS